MIAQEKDSFVSVSSLVAATDMQALVERYEPPGEVANRSPHRYDTCLIGPKRLRVDPRRAQSNKAKPESQFASVEIVHWAFLD